MTSKESKTRLEKVYGTHRLGEEMPRETVSYIYMGKRIEIGINSRTAGQASRYIRHDGRTISSSYRENPNTRALNKLSGTATALHTLVILMTMGEFRAASRGFVRYSD